MPKKSDGDNLRELPFSETSVGSRSQAFRSGGRRVVMSHAGSGSPPVKAKEVRSVCSLRAFFYPDIPRARGRAVGV